jgi:hypothetical protein
MSKQGYTNIYLSIPREDDTYIDELRLEKMKIDKKHYTKSEIVKFLLGIGIDVTNGRYLKLDPNIDTLVSQMQNLIVEMNGQKLTIKKTKEQVYMMLIEKGLQHLND